MATQHPSSFTDACEADAAEQGTKNVSSCAGVHTQN